jgi:hypothetical protein
MAEQTLQALTILQMVQQKKKENQAAPHKCVRNCQPKTRDPALQAQLEGIEASLLRSFPWLQSESFAPIFKTLTRLEHSSPNTNPSPDLWSIDDLKGKLKLHFTQTRKALVNHHNKIIEASRCIHGSGGNNCMHKHLDTFAATPELDVPALLKQNSMEARASGTWDQKTFSALAELSAGPCRQGIREAKRDVSDTMNDLVLNAGLTAVTFGASAYATAALKSAQLAQGAANGGKAVQALSHASRLPRAAQVAVAVSIGADAAWLGPSGSEVLNQCFGEAEQKFGADYREVSVEGRVSCSNDQAKQLSAVSESRNCVMAAALAAMDALPLVPPLAARFSKAKSSIIAAAPNSSKSYKPIQALTYTPRGESKAVAAATVDKAGMSFKPGQRIDVSNWEPGVYPYIIDSSGDLTLANRFMEDQGGKNLVKHDSLLRKVADEKNIDTSKVEVLAAGEIRVEVGASGKPEIVALSNKSGSFRGNQEHLSYAMEELKRRGVDTSQVSTRNYSQKQPDTHASDLQVMQAIKKYAQILNSRSRSKSYANFIQRF